MENKEKFVVITGASTGIGLATSHYLSQQDYAVIGLDKDPSPKDFLGIFQLCDLSDAEKVAAIYKNLAAAYPIYGLVNNAARAMPSNLGNLTVQEFEEVMAVNVRAPLQAIQAVVESMKQNFNTGRIVNIASTSLLGAENRLAYSMSKGALNTMTKSLALELGPSNITVNAVAPGVTATEGFKKYTSPDSDAYKFLMKSIPLGRPGRPEGIAATINFLLSDDADFITGQTIFVCGGMSIGGRRVDLQSKS